MTPAAPIRLVLLAVVFALAAPGSALAGAIDDTKMVTEDTPPEIIDVLANDDQPNTVPNTAQIQSNSLTMPSHGTATVNEDTYDQINYTPNPDYCGSDSFSYTGDYGTATVSVTVTCVDDPATAVNDPSTDPFYFQVEEDSGPVDYDVLVNDALTDPDEGPAPEIESITPDDKGTATLLQGSVGSLDRIRFQPKSNLCGTMQPRYRLQGVVGLKGTASLIVDVLCRQDLPVANNDAFTVGFNGGTALLPVVANDTDADDLTNDFDDIPIIGVTQPLNGTAEIVQGAGKRTDQIAYTPRTGFCGTDSFLYRVFRDEVPQAQVTVTVPCPVPPIVGGGAMGGGSVGGTGGGSGTPQKPVASARAGTPKVAGAAVQVALSCTAAASCTVSLGLTTTPAGASAAARRKAVAIGKAKLTLRPGQKRTATVKLNAAGRRALKKSRKLRAKLAVTLNGKTLSTRTVTFKVKRKR